MDLKNKAALLKRDLPAVFLALKHPNTPFKAKLFGALAVGYALSPVDLVPDFIPVLGYLDDVLILPFLIAACVKSIPPETLAVCRKKAEGMWQSGKPQRWYYALPIIFFWVLLLYLVWRFIF